MSAKRPDLVYPIPREVREHAVNTQECPYCEAAPGTWCHPTKGKAPGRPNTWYVHIPRLEAAEPH